MLDFYSHRDTSDSQHYIQPDDCHIRRFGSIYIEDSVTLHMCAIGPQG